MKLKILLPAEILMQEEVNKVTAESLTGSFCLLPRHVDFVAPLSPGLLSYENENNEEIFLAVNGGLLVKCGEEVLVSTLNAVKGGELGELLKTVEEKFRVLDEREKSTRSALARLEANIVRRYLEIQETG